MMELQKTIMTVLTVLAVKNLTEKNSLLLKFSNMKKQRNLNNKK